MLAHERSWRPPYRVPPPHPRERRARLRKRRHQSEYAWPPPCRRDFGFVAFISYGATIGQRRRSNAITAWSGNRRSVRDQSRRRTPPSGLARNHVSSVSATTGTRAGGLSRPRQWVSCPARSAHIFVGAGD